MKIIWKVLNFCNISNFSFPRGMMSKFPGERGMKIRPIPRGIGDGDPRGINPTYNVAVLKNVVTICYQK